MKTWSVVALIALGAACGGEPEAEAPVLSDVKEPDRAYLPKEVTTTAMEASAQLREPGKFVADAGQFVLEVPVDKDTWRFEVGLDLVALRLGDVPTLEYPIGFVKLDPLSLDGGALERDRTIVDVLLRNQGSAIQIFFDVTSVGDMEGRLPESGGTATGRLLGTVQIDDRTVDVDIPAHFARKDKTHLAIEIEPFELSLAEVGLAPKLQKLAKVLGKKSVGPKVRVSGGVQLIGFDGPQLPTFARTPVTINSVEEVRQRIDAEIDDAEAARIKLQRTGTGAVVGDSMKSKFFEEGRRLMEQNRNGGRPVLENAAHD